MNDTVLITGGAGFIGSHVAELFLTKGWSVEIVDNLSTGKRENVPSGARLHVCDINSPDAAALAGRGFDVLVHLAAQMDVRVSVADPMRDASTNILGTLNLMEALRRSAAKTRVVFSSTGGAVYGDHAQPPNAETTPKEPDSPYAVSKLAGEYYLSYYSRIHGLDGVALRLANVYGPRQDPHGEAGVVAIFAGRALTGDPLTVYGDGHQTRDYVYVSDVAEAVYAAARIRLPAPTGINPRAFNIGTGRATSVLDLIDALQPVIGRQLDVKFAPERRGEQKASFLNIDKARAELGWSPRVALDSGLADTFAWFQARAARASVSVP